MMTEKAVPTFKKPTKCWLCNQKVIANSIVCHLEYKFLKEAILIDNKLRGQCHLIETAEEMVIFPAI